MLLTAVFPPEPVVSGRNASDLAQELARRGHRVTVLAAFPNRPAGRLYPGYDRRLYLAETLAPSLRVVRCFSFLSPASRLLSRLMENVSFGLTSSAALLTGDRPDALYLNTWPIFATGLTALVAKARGIPVVFTVQDIYPESLISQGRLGNRSRLAGIMRWIDGQIARNAEAVIVISEAFAQIYREDRRVSTQRLHVVPNWGEATAASTSGTGMALRDEVGIPRNGFLIVYGGNVGVAAGLEKVIRGLGCIRQAERPYLLIAGSGSRLDACRALAEEIDPKHVRFYSPWPADKTGVVYAAADLLVLPTCTRQSLASAPSKLISYMLANRPVLAQALSASDTAIMIHEAACGWVVEPDDEALLIRAIQQIRTLSASERAARGQAGRDYALKHLTRDACLPRVATILEDVAGEHQATATKARSEAA